MTQSIFHSKDKQTQAGELQAVVKVRVATALRAAFKENHPDIPERFSELLADNCLAPAAFFEGKASARLSSELTSFLSPGYVPVLKR